MYEKGLKESVFFKIKLKNGHIKKLTDIKKAP